MNVCILMGSKRQGNTAALTQPFVEELETLGHHCQVIWLPEKEIKHCCGCRLCQKDHLGFGCFQKDDMGAISQIILDSNLLVLATPIYSWFCTPSMKAMLDRLVYGMNKYYGEIKGPSLWAGKKLALLTTCGYSPEKGADLWLEGIRRYCKHSGLVCLGHQTERHLGYDVPFMDKEKESHARDFARGLSSSCDTDSDTNLLL